MGSKVRRKEDPKIGAWRAAKVMAAVLLLYFVLTALLLVKLSYGAVAWAAP